MKTTKRSLFIFLSLLLLSKTELIAQGCPPPLNFQVDIINSIPPVAHLTWDAPLNGSITGYQLTYSIDNQAPVVIFLPLQPEEFDLVLPEEWTSFEASLASICENGDISDNQNVRKDNIIIIDLVLANTGGAAELAVCSGVCPTATHFIYSGSIRQAQIPVLGIDIEIPLEEEPADEDLSDEHQLSGSGTNTLDLFQVTSFCDCMQAAGSNFGDPVQVGICKTKTKDQVNPNLYNLSLCTTIQPRNAVRVSTKYQDHIVWPNPFSQSFIVQVNTAFDTGEFRLLDTKGQLIIKRELQNTGSSQGLQITLPELPEGLYYYDIRLADGQFWSGKVIKH